MIKIQLRQAATKKLAIPWSQFTFNQPRVIYWHLFLFGVILHITTRGKYIVLPSPQQAKPEAY